MIRNYTLKVGWCSMCSRWHVTRDPILSEQLSDVIPFSYDSDIRIDIVNLSLNGIQFINRSLHENSPVLLRGIRVSR